MTADHSLRQYVIYERPVDYPDHFVVRGVTIGRGSIMPDAEPKLANSLQEARRHVPQGLYRLPRFADDVPSIVEVWL